MPESQFLADTVTAGGRQNAGLLRLRPIRIVALVYLFLCLLGAVLLSLPVAQVPGHVVSPLDCLFTATSAVTLTGLVTVSTADNWSLFGQCVLLFLMQIGGLVIIIAATNIGLLLGLRIGLPQKMQVVDAHGSFGFRHAWRVARYVLGTTLILEFLGALALTVRLVQGHGLPWGQAFFSGVFYSISAFCNAGFTLTPGFMGMQSYFGDMPLLTIIAVLVLLGGLGFGVIMELFHWRVQRRLSVQAKVVLASAAVLVLLGAAMIILLEGHNAATLEGLSSPQRLFYAFFLAITARTGGFTPIDMMAVFPTTWLILCLLMFVGAAPGSTGGGVKTTTIATIGLAIRTMMQRKEEIEIFGRRISGTLVRLALSLVTMYVLGLLVMIVAVSMSEITLRASLPANMDVLDYQVKLVFEVISAFTNTGFTTGITPQLLPATRWLLIIAMLLGRIGPLAFVYVFARRKKPTLRHLPVEPMMAG